MLTFYLKATPFNTFAKRADPDQAAWSGSTLFAYVNMIRYDPTLVDLTEVSLFYVQMLKYFYVIIYYGWSLASGWVWSEGDN